MEFATTRRRRRPGFTLVELMVVLTILLILAALTAGAVVRYITVQEQANTETAIRKLSQLLDTARKGLVSKANAEPIPDALKAQIDAVSGGNPERTRVIYIKLRLKQTFPTSFAEALSPAPLAPLPTYQKKLNALGITGSSASTLPFESGACLLMALEQANGGRAVTADDIGPSSLFDFPAGSGKVRVPIDGWGSPLAFCRWPWLSDELNPGGNPLASPPTGNPHVGLLDPDDPRGLLTEVNWWTTYSPSVNAWFGYTLPGRVPATSTTNPNSPQSYNLTPLIVSAGGDKKLGLDPTNGMGFTVTNPNPDANDNIYSNRLK